MDQHYVMGIDEGTTSARTLIFDGSGQIVTSAAKELTQIHPQAAWTEHNPTEILNTQIDTMRQALRKAELRPTDIRTIGLTNQRESAMVWDRKTGEPVHNLIVWHSRQSVDIIERWAAEGLNDTILSKTGLPSDAYFSASKIAWILENVDGARERAERGELCAGTVDSWLIWNLCGGRYVTEYSNASRTMLFNIHTLDWDDELLEAFGIPRELLAEILPSDSDFGTVGRVFDVELPIQGNLGDQQAGLFGQACYEPGLAKYTYGTAGVYTMNTGTQPAYRDGLTASVAWSVRGTVEYATEGVTFSSGATIQWLRDSAKMVHGSEDTEWYAAKVPDTQGVYLVPAFAGLCAPYWDPYARAAIIGMASNATREHIIRAGLESMAYQARDSVEAVRKGGDVEVNEIRVDGGAAQNDLLCQFQADILGLPVVRPKVTEATVLGAAYMAGLVSGLWKDQQELAGLWQEERTFEPQMPEHRREELYEGWLAAVDLTRGWAQRVPVASQAE